ncbi:MAG: hypothetical protein Sapg2KO_13670 [Saprospiraceae bacterium]
MKYLLSLIILSTIISCSTKKEFNSDEWINATGESLITDVREVMVEDIIESDLLIDKNRSDIEVLLGTEYYQTDSTMGYLVREKYGWNIDPIYIKYLNITIDDNGVARQVNIKK